MIPPPEAGVVSVETNHPELSKRAEPKKSKLSDAADAEAAQARGRMVLLAAARAVAREDNEGDLLMTG